MDGPEKVSFNRSARPLRFINIVAFMPGIILLLITALTTRGSLLNLIAIAPLALSALLGLVCVAGKDRPMPWTIYADLCIAMFFVSVLVPLYIRSGGPSQTSFDSLTTCNYFRLITLAAAAKSLSLGVSEILLCAYGTMPLLVDLYVICCPNYALSSISPPSLSANLVKTWNMCMYILQLDMPPS